MKRLLAVMLACGAGVCQSGGEPAISVPAWMAAYPGAKADTRTLPNLIEITYQANAASSAVVAHYAKLFESAGLTFAPTFDGMGTVIRASAAECDLWIKIREQNGGSFVRVSCAVKTPTLTAVATPPPTSAVPARMTIGRDAVQKAEEADRNRMLEMKKYDEPVQARARTTPTWPVWLTQPDGTRFPVRKAAGDSTFLSAGITVAAELEAVQAYYANLVESNGCAVSRGRAWLEGSCKPDPRSVKILIIRAELSPASGGTHVQVRVSSIP